MKRHHENQPYIKLLRAIKSSDIDKYEPKKYSFNLCNFDEKGKIKKEN